MGAVAGAGACPSYRNIIFQTLALRDKSNPYLSTPSSTPLISQESAAMFPMHSRAFLPIQSVIICRSFPLFLTLFQFISQFKIIQSRFFVCFTLYPKIFLLLYNAEGGSREPTQHSVYHKLYLHNNWSINKF
jgi:hypothetical protein